MQEYYFEYRGGEIVATVKATSLSEALDKFDKKQDVTYDIEVNMLLPDMWTYECDELAIVAKEEFYRQQEDDDEDI
ncbi:hypothetical protein FCU45_00905 [Sulfurimonas crateris]|uniref:Uncharacterized protein n=1 Tax=Sulfurimonas crateris TaxID=2574727 RepID=A0A4U2Z9M8_9BACT|nr:hypothetical protein [Sulfurimonas crateris]TKI70979.1 hypothetical protein FCU45_00905 [Sulfurimonas crateris]